MTATTPGCGSNSESRKRLAEQYGCHHGVDYDTDCASCDADWAEANAAGAWTPNEIGIYFRGKRAGEAATEALVEAARLEPAENMALTVAWHQVERGEHPMGNVAAVCVMALERIRRAALRGPR